MASTQNKMDMPVIGLVGGIGSGKSTVAGIFHDLGCDVINADYVGHDVLKEGWGKAAAKQGLRRKHIRPGRRDRPPVAGQDSFLQPSRPCEAKHHSASGNAGAIYRKK